MKALPMLPKLKGPTMLKVSMRPGTIKGMPEPLPGNYDNVPEMPADFVGSEPEWRVFWWLTRHNYEFEFQNPVLGGRKMLGGQVVDFVVYSRTPPLVIGVQGEYWHFGTSGLRAQDLIEKIQLLNRGYDVVFVRESDIMERLNYTMEKALEGVQLYED